jgi:hypothetical protein
MAKTITLHFEGYYTEKDLPLIDYRGSGIYAVYRGKQTRPSYCELRELLYIGESEELSERLDENHEHYFDWLTHLEDDEVLYFAITNVDSVDRERAEAALIYHHQQRLPCNSKGKKSFSYPETYISISGDCELLNTEFTEP